MCGIAGVIVTEGEGRSKAEVLAAMCRLQWHRGPDADGTLFSGEAALGHRRLSIIDLSGGAQPMRDAASGVAITFNGEIYNFPELRAELEAKGQRFTSHSDTEVILRGYLVWGQQVVQRLNGMFAFAIWDRPRRTLFAARDRLGKKPFYWHASKAGFWFASEMKAILADREVAREIDPAAIDRYLSLGYVPAPGSIFKGIEKLRPGHQLIWESGRVESKPYWEVQYQPNEAWRNEKIAVDHLLELLRAAVKRRMISDVPLGAFLSGGLDSSVVVALMAEVSAQPVKTFTIRFEEMGYSEGDDALRVARHLKTDHQEFTVKPDAVSLLPELVWHFDEPFADSSAVPTYYVSKMARQVVTVALSGDGGDELFAGYREYLRRDQFKNWAKIPGPVRRALLRPLGRKLPPGFPGKNILAAAGAYAEQWGGKVYESYPFVKHNLLSADFLAQITRGAGLDEVIDYWSARPQGPQLSILQYLDTKLYLPDDILTKVDRMSMAPSLETRAPLLDYTVAEFAATLPADLQMKDGKGKYVLRQVAARLLPKEVLEKPKQGFAVPRDVWFRGALRHYAEDLLRSKRFKERGYFKPSAVENILDEHQKGVRDYSFWIWAMIQLELWHQTFFDAETRRV